jgi:hypothetical protein
MVEQDGSGPEVKSRARYPAICVSHAEPSW